MTDPAYSLIKGLRVTRSFRPRALDRSDLDAILEAGRWTGSSKNRPGWVLVVIEEAPARERLATAGDYTDPVRQAAAAVALVKTEDGNDFDIGRLGQNLMLAAATRGVGSCPVTLHHTEIAHRVLDGSTSPGRVPICSPGRGVGCAAAEAWRKLRRVWRVEGEYRDTPSRERWHPCPMTKGIRIEAERFRAE